MKDEGGIVQVFEVSIHGGPVRQVTKLDSSIQAQFNVSPDGKSLALIADNSIWIADVRTSECKRLTARTSDELAPVLAVIWNRSGDTVVYNRYTPHDSQQFLQIYKIRVN
jgi:Tol biopolymer transport system component